MNHMPADLHCHTRISDGSISLDDLILLAKRRNITTISVTDHDTLAGVTRAKVLGGRFGIDVIPGAEFSCYDSKTKNKVHLLAYLFDHPDRLEGLCKRTGELRKKASLQCLSKVMRYYPVTSEMVARVATGSTNIFKQHIMHVLMNAGYSTSVFGELFDKLFDSKNGTCIVHPEYPDVYEVLELLKSSGAVTVLAHPTVYDNMPLLPDLIDAGLDGVEVWHPRNSEEDKAELFRIAEKHDLVMTGGSDFHGMYSAGVNPLGSCTTPDECLAALRARKDRRRKK